MTRHTHHLLPLLLLLPTLCFSKHVNVTVDDTAAGLVYLPLEAWRSSSNACVGCLNPSTSTAMNGTFHGATHALPAPDADDIGATDPDASSTKKPASSTIKPASSTSAPKATSKPDTDGDAKGGKDTDADGDHGGSGSSKGGSGKSRRMLHLERLDANDEGFVDPPVTAQFNFTGTAIYIYAQPLIQTR
ncbi:hypothetical protein BDQ12DRAFT_472057 [Crucibulum laeve]|uniref:Uncharacterized protein n=1 Tax=Crucibulum laeve TaxID=68775 RepID=A0A5C3LJQ6_9AGAR|nr:hypothetical protein BDQ12DRAFT_472057 [Crucibulum laeve]